MYFSCPDHAAFTITKSIVFPIRCWCGVRADSLDSKYIHEGEAPKKVMVSLPKMDISPARKIPRMSKIYPCIWLGNPTGEMVACLTCRGETRLKLFFCDIFGKCTTHKKVDTGLACCYGCEARVSPEGF